MGYYSTKSPHKNCGSLDTLSGTRNQVTAFIMTQQLESSDGRKIMGWSPLGLRPGTLELTRAKPCGRWGSERAPGEAGVWACGWRGRRCKSCPSRWRRRRGTPFRRQAASPTGSNCPSLAPSRTASYLVHLRRHLSSWRSTAPPARDRRSRRRGHGAGGATRRTSARWSSRTGSTVSRLHFSQ